MDGVSENVGVWRDIGGLGIRERSVVWPGVERTFRANVVPSSNKDHAVKSPYPCKLSLCT